VLHVFANFIFVLDQKCSDDLFLMLQKSRGRNRSTST